MENQNGKETIITPELQKTLDQFIRDRYIPPEEQEISSFDLRKNRDEDEEIPKSRIDLESGEPVLSDIEKWTNIDDVVSHVGATFQKKLFQLIREKGMNEVEVYQKAQVDRKIFSKIRRHEDYIPKKRTILALALALQLNLDETKDLLSRAGQALSPSSKGDLIVEYCIENEIYDLFNVNALLFKYGEHILP
jgi:hypothetical protein